jgi:simple sugar transport system ATP-binding protein
MSESGAVVTAGACTAPAVAMRGITKRFPGVLANDAVDLEVAVGEVHALLGENGAGKSTLSNILTGLYQPDAGSIELWGEPVRFAAPRDALEAGVSMVHQHFRLVEPFTVAENVLLGDEQGPGASFALHPREVEQEVAELAERYGLPVQPDARIWQLSVGEQQRVEILKALHRNARVLILDEPTAVLTPQEVDALFPTLRQMAAEGRTVIFISHKLHEVMAVSDRVTVLRGGRSIGTMRTSETSAQALAALMVGREVAAARREVAGHEIGETVLRVAGLECDGDRGQRALHDVSFELRAGEILAVAGVAGNGQRELAEAITGLRGRTAGSVRVGGRELRAGDPRDAIRHGVAHVPEDRLGTGVSPGLSIAANGVLKSYRSAPASRGPLLRLAAIRELAVRAIERYDVRAPGPETPARLLSGGNLQKVVLAREFEGAPRVLVAASPTRGLDVGSIETVQGYLREAAADGVGVLLISEDLDEILTLADRIAVLYEGRVMATVPAADARAEDLGLLMAGVGS